MRREARVTYNDTQAVRIAGKERLFPAIPFDGVVIVLKGTLMKVAEIQDEFYLESRALPEPEKVLQLLRAQRPRPDLFTFAQKLPAVVPKYSYPMEWDNVAAIKITSYEQWFKDEISRKAMQSITKAERKGVVTRVANFDQNLIAGISSIYNETPVRQGKPFWHYGKSRQAVEEENATFPERSRFIGAYVGEELIGFIKMVFDGKVALLLQILSKRKHSDKSPTNALLSRAVRLCADEGMNYLVYERYIYGNKTDSPLVDFKRHNGFIQINIPRYYVPLTLKGFLVFRCGFHHGLKALIPQALVESLVALRARYYQRKKMAPPGPDNAKDGGD